MNIHAILFLKMKLSTRIKIELLGKGVSGAAIARQLGVDRTAIYHVIAGRSRSQRLRLAIANALGVTVKDLWPDEITNHRHRRKAA